MLYSSGLPYPEEYISRCSGCIGWDLGSEGSVQVSLALLMQSIVAIKPLADEQLMRFFSRPEHAVNNTYTYQSVC